MFQLKESLMRIEEFNYTIRHPVKCNKHNQTLNVDFITNATKHPWNLRIEFQKLKSFDNGFKVVDYSLSLGLKAGTDGFSLIFAACLDTVSNSFSASIATICEYQHQVFVSSDWVIFLGRKVVLRKNEAPWDDYESWKIVGKRGYSCFFATLEFGDYREGTLTSSIDFYNLKLLAFGDFNTTSFPDDFGNVKRKLS